MSRYPFAIAAGLAIWLAFPGHDLWFLAPVGVAVLALATRGTSARQGGVLGLLCGLAYFVPLLSWSGIYVGAFPWVALSVLQALYVALLGLASAVLQRAPSLGGRHRVRPVVVAGLWVAQEALRGRTPFGGFPWGRLAFSQADAPLAHLAALAGAPGVTFGVALAGGLLAVAISRLAAALQPNREVVHGQNQQTGRLCTGRTSRPGGCARRRGLLALPAAAAAAAGGAVALTLLPSLVATPTAGQTARFMAVQGNVPKPGLDFNAERRAVLDNHATLTRAAADAVKAGTQPQPDLVVWPENASDIDPLRNPDAGAIITEATDTIGAPVLVGAVLEEPAPHLSNASLLYRPGKGLTQRYVKAHPVPFAEYIPFRSFFRLFSDKVDLLAQDFVAGHGVGVFHIPGTVGRQRPSGAATVISAGAVICFEVAYDTLVRDTVDHGANVLLVQTNNATFGFSDESVQQLAISRIRAIEHGRSVVHVSTVGVSALITPDGTAHQRSALFTSALLAGDLPLRTDRTVADWVGAWPEYLTCGVVALLLLRLGLLRLRLGAAPPRVGSRPTQDKGRSMTRSAPGPERAPSGSTASTGPAARGPVGRVIVLIPTYNERENLPLIVRRVRAAVPEADLVVLDDSSPDGTGAVADELADGDPAVHVLHRSVKEGLGAAYLAGFAWALEQGYDALVEMDADGSHQPEQLRSLLSALEGADLVLGSRWVPGGSVVNWPLTRRALSRGGNLYTRILLGMPIGDATGGYRVYRASALRSMDLHDVASLGYCFQVDLVWRAVRRGLRVVEVPITFVEREIGNSKMSHDIVKESLRRITAWGAHYRAGQLRSLVRREPTWHRLDA